MSSKQYDKTFWTFFVLGCVVLILLPNNRVHAQSTQDPNLREGAPQGRQMQEGETQAVLKIPKKLWDQIEAQALVNAPSSSQKKTSIVSMPFKVELLQKTSGVLTDSKGFTLEFQSGSGSIDFKDFVTPQKGSFYFRIVPDADIVATGQVRVFFISHAKQRLLDTELHGSGCGVYLDISSYFLSTMLQQGILASTAQLRYATVLSGLYIVTVVQEQKIHVAHLKVYDSRYPVLQCEQN